MTLPLILICLLAALLATGAGALCAALRRPGWLCRIVELAVLLLAAFVWLGKIV